MNILFLSYTYAPLVGGIENCGRILTEQFVRHGHEVVVATATPGADEQAGDVRIVRSLTSAALKHWRQWCDIVVYNNITLRVPGPLLFRSRPVMVIHHTWLRRIDSSVGWQDRLKRRIIQRAENVCVSRALAEDLSVKAHVIRNPFEAELFRPMAEIKPGNELVFLGRLVSDKGVSVLIRALERLHRAGRRYRLSIIGQGPEAEPLRAQVRAAGLSESVTFHGQKTGAELVALLNRHRVMVVPSVWAEVYGLVVLEGLACGLKVIASRTGGLPEALGSAGLLYENRNDAELADCIERALHSESTPEWRATVEDHLALHQPEFVASQYLKLMLKMVDGSKSKRPGNMETVTY